MDEVTGVAALALGLALALSGSRLHVFLLPISGFVAGFFSGAAIITVISGGGFLSTTLGIVIGMVCGVVFALLSHHLWYVGVVLTSAIAGGILGAALFGTLGVRSEWLLVTIAALVAAVFAVGACVINYPEYLVIVSTSLAGSANAVGGLLLVTNKIDREEIGTGSVWRQLDEHWLLWLIWAGIAAVGLLVQLAARDRAALPEHRWVQAS